MKHPVRIGVAASTTRPLSSLLLFLIVASAFVLAGRDWGSALFCASPMLTICLAGFCINDIFDQEMDRINHPDRTLANYPALSNSVLGLYVVLFLITLGLILVQETATVRFTWAVSFILLSNYSVFKRNFPLLKNAYIAVAVCVVGSILDEASEPALPIVVRYGPLFAANFAREMLLDIPDMRGDKDTLVLKLQPRRSLYLAMTLYFVALLLTVYFATTPTRYAIATAGFVCFLCYAIAKLKVGLHDHTLRPITAVLAAVPAVLVIT